MKKSKLLVGVLVASMALLGTGYAYWNDTLTVNATVNTGELTVEYAAASDEGVTGELNETAKVPGDLEEEDAIKTIPVSGQNWYYYWDNPSKDHSGDAWKQGYELGETGLLNPWKFAWFTSIPKTTGTPGTPGGETVANGTTGASAPKGAAGEAGYISKARATVNGDAKGVTIEIDDFYPGSFAATSFTVTNTGTIPAVLDTATVDFKDGEDNDSLDDALKVVAVLGSPATITINDELLAKAKSLSEINDVFKDLYIEPIEPGDNGEETTLIFILPGEVEEFESSDSWTFVDTFDLEFIWTQHNALKTSEKPAEE